MSLATRVNEQMERAQTAPGRPTIAQLIDRQKPEIARALPSHMNPDRLARIATTVIRQTPRLMECSAESLLGALMTSAQTGLEPGPLGHAYFVPRWNGKTKSLECQWMLGYKGIVELARRSGQIVSIEARVVHEADEFEFAYGLEDRLHHRPHMGGDPGPMVAVYGVARFKDGGHYFVVLSRADVERRASRSETWGKDWSPWKSDYEAMAMKTAVRAMAPFLPLSPEQAGVLARDEHVRTRIDDDLVDDAPAYIEAHAELEAGEAVTAPSGQPPNPGDGGAVPPSPEPASTAGVEQEAGGDAQPIGAKRGQELHREAGRIGVKDKLLQAAVGLVVSSGRTTHYGELFDGELRHIGQFWAEAASTPVAFVEKVVEALPGDHPSRDDLLAYLDREGTKAPVE